MAKFNRLDLKHVLVQILMAEAGQDPLSPHLAFGLRTLRGFNNNTVPGNEFFGAADQLFPRLGVPVFRTAEVQPADFFGPGPAGTTPTSYLQTSGFVFDSQPRTISNLISDQTANNPAALEAQAASTPGTGYLYSHRSPINPAFDPAQPPSADNPPFLAPVDSVALPSAVDASGNLFIANVTPDAGLSAPFNSWLAFFGQFFDHGLDKVTNGGNGTVFIPLKPDDPLMVVGADGIAGTGDEMSLERFDGQRFMVMTRATQFQGPGADGILGNADDTFHEAQNTVTPFVDQNQTYSSHPSHQVFLRAYALDANGKPQATGLLITNRDLGADGKFDTAAGGDDTEIGGMATWGVVKAQAHSMLGLNLTDADVDNVPLLATDEFGRFVRGPNGFVQVVMKADALHATSWLMEGDPTANDGKGIDLSGAERTGHAFLNDIAHAAAPKTGLLADTDTTAGPISDGAGGFLAQPADTYDNELLDAHYIAGDGRVNENIGLISVHEIFHSEHNRQIGLIKDMVRTALAEGDSSFATDWVLPGANLADGIIQDNEWNGERLFQAAKFATETQYQHLVFEEFARKIAPTINLFGNNNINLDPAITAEFAHAVYRFGHSMLDENVNRYVLHDKFLADDVTLDPLAGTPVMDANGDPVLNEIGLIDAFLNPLEYAARGANAAGEIILGSVNQIGNEIDEFVTGALRNNLVGLPIDLAAINIARGRDTGVPTLNLLRNQLFTATNDLTLKAYASWYEFGQFLKHPASLVNFVAAYATDPSVADATTLAGKRAAAQALVDGAAIDPATGQPVNQAAYDFMHSLGSFTNNKADTRAIQGTDGLPPQWSTGSVTGLDHVDLWIGGLAEKQSLFGGLLGSTFNFIFETQLEALQDADRMYYLPRIEGMQWGQQIENNSFAELIMLNTNVKHLSASIFLTPEYVVEAATVTNNPSTWLRNPVTGALLVEKLADGTVHFIGDDNFFGNTMVLGGTEGNDRLQAGHADDDTVYGDGGDDWLDGGNGNDFIYGGTGNDIVRDSGGDDVIHGDDGDDDLDGGIGDDIIFGNAGNDLIHGGNSILGDTVIGGLGNDILFGDEGDDALEGNEGDDWISGGTGGDGLVGDSGAPTGQVPLFGGNDVLDGGAQGDKMNGFSGDDIMLGEGGFDTFGGLLGFDWADFEKTQQGVSIDMDRRQFVPVQTAPAGDAVRDVFIETEAVSGTAFDDVLKGSTNAVVVNAAGVRVGGAASIFNVLENVDLIFGLAGFFAPGAVYFDTGNIMLGGDGSDSIEGRAGDDIIDGDAWLHVDLTRDANGNVFAGSEITRDILFDIIDGDVDTAVYTDVLTNYTISAAPDAQGFYTVTQTAVTPGIGLVPPGDGVDRIRNIERLQFSDGTFSLNQLLGLAPGPNENAVPTGALILATAADNPATPLVDVTVGTQIVATDNIADTDGIVPGSVRYQWQDQQVTAGGGIQWVDISGANGLTFTPTNTQSGNALRLFMTYTDGLGFREQAVSLPTALLAPNVTVNTAPFINPQQNPPGLPDTNARTGNLLNLFLNVTSVFGDLETAPAALVYTATLANGQALDGSAAAGGLLFVVQGAAGAVTGAFVVYDPDGDGTANPLVAPLGAIEIRVTATDTAVVGPNLSVTDTFLINVQRGNTAPIAGAFAPQSISEGDGLVGGADTFVGTLTGSDPDGTPVAFRLVANSVFGGSLLTFNQSTGAFTFLATGEEFAGATLPAGAGFAFTTFDGQLSSAASQVRFDVNAVDDGQADFRITGTAATGGTLTALIGVDPDGAWDETTATYEWFRDGVLITGLDPASPDYLVQATDVGHTLHAAATYTDGQGFVATIQTAETSPIGVLAIEPLRGVNTATVTVFNSLNDPDGNPTPDNTFYDWETSADGIIWVAAAGVSADGLSITQANSVTQFVRVTTNFIDEAGNLNTATSAPVRVQSGAGGAQTMTGIAGTDIFFGLGGTDNISTGGGNDILVGGAGNDTLNGGAGNDRFFYQIGDGADTVLGGAGTDLVDIVGTAAAETLSVSFNGTRITAFQGGTIDAAVEQIKADLLAGTDSLVYTSTTSVIVDLLAGTASGFTSIANIENVNGGSGADTITGDDNANVLTGNVDADVLNGGGGADTLIGGAGNDTLNGGAGNDTFVYTIGDGADTVLGGDGANDRLQILGTGGNDTLTVTYDGTRITTFQVGTVDAGVESVTANLLGGANDTLAYTAPGGVSVDLAAGTASGFTSIANIENVNGNGGADTITGDGNANVINGNGGADVLNGGGGGDTLSGGIGNDTLNGGAGNDNLNGGAGADTLIGGNGIDTINTGAPDDNVSDLVRFSATTAFGDTVSNFDVTGTSGQIDHVQFGGALNTAFDDRVNDDAFAFAVGNGANGGNTAANLNGTIEALYLAGTLGEGVTNAQLGNANAIATEFNAEFAITAANGEDALLVVNDTDLNSFAIWQWVQQAGGNAEIDAAELTLIGIFAANGTVGTGAIDFIV
ncbi:MAG: peroxidase family protein [Hyphomonadaceae bacterium]